MVQFSSRMDLLKGSEIRELLKLTAQPESEVTSQAIGEMVMDGLKALDEVAYVRFASVYREFKDVNTFMDELKKILN